MWKFLESLRLLPEDSRRGLAILFATALTFLIFVPWFIFSSHSTGGNSDTKSTEDVLSPFALVGERLSDIALKAKSEYGTIEGVTKNFMAGAGASKEVEAGKESSTSPTN